MPIANAHRPATPNATTAIVSVTSAGNVDQVLFRTKRRRRGYALTFASLGVIAQVRFGLGQQMAQIPGSIPTRPP
jgi:hypothetical protein